MIVPLPEIPHKIKEAYEADNLVVFVGAGVSKLIGCPSWRELSEKVVRDCATNLSYRESESLLQIVDPKKILSICKQVRSSEDDFVDSIRNSLVANETDLNENENIYQIIKDIGTYFVTTNIDCHFDNKFSRIVAEESEFSSASINDDNLYKLHGSLTAPHTIVLTARDYLKRYKDGNRIKEFLRQLFTKNVLFIGYGLTEFEVIQHLQLPEQTADEPFEIKHYILDGYFQGDQKRLDLDNLYYRQLGIECIGYEKDEKGYKQLKEVLINWHQILEERPPLEEMQAQMDMIDEEVV
ncbi:MAG TPA: SIR2 family protein [Candidatus Kapabacteria bacterium]